MRPSSWNSCPFDDTGHMLPQQRPDEFNKLVLTENFNRVVCETLAKHIDPSLPELLHGDPGRLRQILVNLGGNAVKFTSKGFIKLAVKTHDEDDHVRCTFEITDTGIGISAEMRESVFVAFVQTEQGLTRRRDGTGLGLTISRELARRMGGDLTLRSEEGEGSCFTLWLCSASPDETAG